MLNKHIHQILCYKNRLIGPKILSKFIYINLSWN